MPKPIKIFIAYSRADIAYLNELRTHLTPLLRSGKVQIWYDGKIEPGVIWETAIKENLHNADVILLLVSADAIASDYFYDKEMSDALERHKKGQARVVPLIIRPCAWHTTPLASIQALPKDGKPVTTWTNKDDAYNNAINSLWEMIGKLEAEQEQEQERLAEEARKAKQDKETAQRAEQERLKAAQQKAEEVRQKQQQEEAIRKEAAHKRNEETARKKEQERPAEHKRRETEQPVSANRSPSQTRKYSIYAGLAIVGIIAVIFIVRAFTGGSSKGCTDPVQVFKDVGGKAGLKLCEKVILPPTYDDITYFSEGLALVEKDKLFGFIDEKGTLVIETKYEKAESFSNGKALVNLNGENFYIDKSGKCVEDCPGAKTSNEVIEDPRTLKVKNDYDKLIGLAEYNFKEGDYVLEKKAIDQAKKYYESALKYYRDAIGLVEDDRKAKEGEKKTIDRLNEIDKLKKAIMPAPAKKEITDKRSGYKTVDLVGKTWLAENLNVDIKSSGCYDNKDANCDKYGRLYTWKAAGDACRALGSGWRLPKKGEWNDLISECFSTRPTPSTKAFNILPSGKRSRAGEFSELGRIGYYWHSAEDGDDNVFSFEIGRLIVKSRGDFMADKDDGYSCRCIKDD